jgi:hypothetical protein
VATIVVAKLEHEFSPAQIIAPVQNEVV